MNVEPPDEGPAGGTARRDPRRPPTGDPAATGRRPGWLLLAAFTLAFAAFEAAKHQGWTLPAAAVGAALPLLLTRVPGALP
ncbi:hypothetical protein GL263_26970, partial [Streptomyces durbertensis]|nr:hypothetical protein [Streptomyces durbertensis]